MLQNEGSRPTYQIHFASGPGIGDVDPRLVAAAGPGITILPNMDVLEAALLVSPDEIVVAPDERRGMKLDSLLLCKKEGFPVVQYLTFLEHEIRRVDIRRVEVGWLLYSSGFYFGTIDNALKRALDIAAKRYPARRLLALSDWCRDRHQTR